MENLNYVINENVKVATEMQQYVKAGIHENIVLVEAKHEVLDNGGEFLSLQFRDEKGNKLSFTDWPITPFEPLSEMSEESKKAFETKFQNRMSVLRQFIIALTGKKDVSINASSFKELAQSLVKLFSGDTNLVRVKATYDKKGWVTIPKTHWATVIESMDIPTEESTIEILASDLMERPTNLQKDVEKKEENPIDDGEYASTDTEDAPF